jgi:hypothetical protein
VSATLSHEIKVGIQYLLECCSNRGDCHVASISFDDLSTESEFIVNQLVSFMDGRTNYVGSGDPYHAAK